MSAIPDFDAQERRQIDVALALRFGHAPGLEPADSELRLDPGTPVLTSCPTLYWSVQDCHFLLFKTGERRYRCQFFYTENEHYGAGATEFGRICRKTIRSSLLPDTRAASTKRRSRNESACVRSSRR